MNLVLPGRGRVWTTAPVLYQYSENEDPLDSAGGRWTDRKGGLIGGTPGGILGLLGMMVGILCPLGRARSFVIGVMITATILGITTFAVGALAFYLKQPFGVYCPLLLSGGLAAVIFGALIRVVRKRYTEIELRRMTVIN